jgi:hypothetical protein
MTMTPAKLCRPRFILLLASLLALTSASVAFADGPVVNGPNHYEGSDELWDCGSFKIIDYYVLNVTGRIFYNESGTVDHVVDQLDGTDTFTNSVTGKAYTGNFHNTLTISSRAHGRGFVQAGVIYHLTVPGAGAVLLDVGAIVFRPDGGVFMFAGPHQVLEGDLDGLCAVLA